MSSLQVAASARIAEPWSERDDWKSGRIESSSAPMLRAVVFAVLWNGMTWLSAYALFRNGFAFDPLLLIWGLFPLIAIVSLVIAVRRTFDAIRYGRAVLTLQSVPVPMGGELRGSIRVRGVALRDDEDLLVKLECRATEDRPRAGGRSRGHSVSQRVEWSSDAVVSKAEVSTIADGAMIPVKLPVAAACPEAGEVQDESSLRTKYSWWLVARVEPKGWSAEFEVPVFRTANTPAGAARDEQTSAQRSARPAGTRIVVHSSTSEGTLITYPPSTFFIVVATWFVITLPFYIVLPFDLLHLHWLGPIASFFVVLAANGIPGALFVYYWQRRLLIGPERITLFTGLPFFGTRLYLRTADAGEVKADVDRLSIVRNDAAGLLQRWFFVAPPLKSDAEARWLAAEIERALARHR